MSSTLALPVANNDHFMASHHQTTRRRPTHPDRRRDTFQLLQVMIEENNKRVQQEREVHDSPERRRRSSTKASTFLTGKGTTTAAVADAHEHPHKLSVKFATPPSPTRPVTRRSSTTMEKLRSFLHLSPSSSSSRIKTSLHI